MIESVQKRPLLGLVALAALNLLLLSIQIRSEDGMILLRSWGLTLVSPVALTAQGLSSWSRERSREYLFLDSVRKRNRYLEEENWRLRVELQRLQSVRRRLEREQRFERFRATHDFELQMAAVIWRNLPPYSEKIVINAGYRHAVRKDSPVVASEGVVGRVRALTPWTAEVELLIDVNAAAGAVLESSRLEGIVQGTGRNLLALNFIPVTEQVHLDEKVLTSGTDGIYPKGLAIGRIHSIDRSAGIYQSILVEPLVDFARLEEVGVIVGG